MNDKEKAEEYKTRLRAQLAPVCALLKEAEREGFQLNFNIANSVVTDVSAMKKF